MPSLFGDKLRYLRRQHRLPQVELTQRLGLASQAYISGLEAGHKAPSPDLVVRVAELFTVSIDDLVRDTIPTDTIHASSLQEVRQKSLSLSIFGERLGYLRRQHQLTQTAFAQQLGLASQAYVSSLEAGHKAPSLELVLRIADLFSVTTDFLLCDGLPSDIVSAKQTVDEK